MDSGDVHRPHPVLVQKLRVGVDHSEQRPKKSEDNNGIAMSCRPRPRDVAPRFKSSVPQSPVSSPSTPTSSTSSTPSSSSPGTPPTPNTIRRHLSPGMSRTATVSVTLQPKRAVSAERRPSTPSRSSSTPSPRSSSPSSVSLRPSTPVRDMALESSSTSRRISRAPDGLWPSMRSLFSNPADSKNEKSPGPLDQTKLRDTANSARKRSPSRGRNPSEQSENSRPSENIHAKIIDHHRWPAMIGGRLSRGAMTRSVDLSDKSSKAAQSVVLAKSLKSTSVLSSASVMSRSVDLSDKVKRSFSSTSSSRGSSPIKRTTATSSDVTTDPKVSVAGTGKLISLLVPSRGNSPQRFVASSDTDALLKSSEFPDKSQNALASTPSRGLISPSRGPSPVRIVPVDSDVKSKRGNHFGSTTRSISLSAQSRTISPQRIRTSTGTDVIPKTTELDGDRSNRPTTSSGTRGASPRRAPLHGVPDAISTSDDLTDKSSQSISSTAGSRGISPRRIHTSHGATKEPISQGNSPKKAHASDNGATKETISRGIDTSHGATKEPILRGSSPRKAHASHNGATKETISRGSSPRKAYAYDIPSKDLPVRVVSLKKMPSFEGMVKEPLMRGGSPRRTHVPEDTNKEHLLRGLSLRNRTTDSTSSQLQPYGSPMQLHASDSASEDPSASMGVGENSVGEGSPRRLHVPEVEEPLSGGFSPSVGTTDDLSSELPSHVCSPMQLHVSRSASEDPSVSLGVGETDVKNKADQQMEPKLSIDLNVTSEKEERIMEPKLSNDLNVTSEKEERIKPLKRLTRTLSSPAQGRPRASSPSKAVSISTSAPRRLQSPCRVRPSSPASSSISSTSSRDSTSPVFNYMVDVTKGNKCANQVEETHQLRLLHNRNLQWCFVNAYTNEILAIQKMDSETLLHSVWSTTMRLRESIITKRMYVQQLRQEAKLRTVLNNQIEYLDQWEGLEMEHHNTLSGASEALRVMTLCLPVTAGAKAEMLAIRNAVSSAVDIMQAMSSSVPYLLSKSQGAKSSAAELSSFVLEERAMLNECRELLATSASLQVQECSLRAQLIRQEEIFTIDDKY